MIDIETLSLSKHNALVLSVGMIEFDPTNLQEGLRLGKRELMVLDIPEQIMLKREISKSTQEWWTHQPAEAAKHWRKPAAVCDVDTAMNSVRSFCLGKSRVWANGTQFDLSNLEQLAKDVSQKDELWHYRAPRDMRTFCMEAPKTRAMPDDALTDVITHHPVDDCIVQAWSVWEHWAL